MARTAARRETFLFFRCSDRPQSWDCSIYFTSCVIRGTPEIADHLPKFNEFPLVFSGHNGGGGGNHDPLPASHGNLPRASLDPQLAPPTVILPKEHAEACRWRRQYMVAPDIRLPQGGQIGDPTSQFSRVLSNGPGGPGGIGPGCCDGIGPSTGPGVGRGSCRESIPRASWE